MSEPNPNYITPEGARRLQSELIELRNVARPKVVREVSDAAAQGDRSENAEYIYGKKKLREIDRRIYFLVKRIEKAVLVDPKARPASERGKVFFGATVTLEHEDGTTATYRIVGEDEIDLGKGQISYKSPLARILTKRSVGETVLLRKPSGEAEITIVAIAYE